MRLLISKSTVGVTTLLLAYAPEPASAATLENAPMVGSLGLGLTIALAVIVLLWRQHKSYSAQVASAPIGLVRFKHGRAIGTPLAQELLGLEQPASPENISSAFVGADSRLVLEAIANLNANHMAFEGRFRTKKGHSLSLVGRRAGRVNLLWVSDADQAAQLAEDLAAHSNEREMLRQVIDKLPMPVWWRSKQLDVIGYNTSYGGALGSDAATVNLSESHPELGAGYLDKDGRGLARRATKSGSIQSESHHIVIDGTRRLLEFTEAPIDTRSTVMVGIATDVTMIEAVQSELAALVASHAEVLEMLGAAIAIYGADRRLKFFNSAFLELWRIENTALGGEPNMGEVLDMLRDRRRLPEYIDFPAFKQETDNLFHSLIEPREELLHLPDERTLRMMVSPHPMGGLLFVYEDVTDRLALERSYNTSIAVQRETIDKLYEAVTVFGGDGRLKLWNPAAAAMWDLPHKEAILDSHIGDLIEHTRRYFAPAENWEQRKQGLILSVTEPEPRSGRLERTDGMIIDFSCVPLPDGGCLLGYIDVTDSVRVQRALEERNLALQYADRLKSDFIANVSYELRTPLNAIIGFTEILDKQYFGELNERQDQYVGGVLQASNHLMTLINDILDLATIEAGYLELDLAPLNVHEALANLLNAFRNRAADSKLTLNFDCPPEIGTIVADEKRLRQAVYNLVTNAVQHTPEGGTITLSAHRDSEYLKIIVADTGVGIPEDDVERLFNKFERGDQSARESGAGLGLALVKSLIELHGGEIFVHNDTDIGARIECRLPLTARPTNPGDGAEKISA